jgi:hypothetical protein
MVGKNGEELIKISDLFNETEKGSVLKPYEELSKIFPKEKQRAVLKLYSALSKNKLVAWDISMPNIYFKQVGEEWVAGILDVDFIADSTKPAKNITWRQIQYISEEPYAYQIKSVMADGRKMNNSAKNFMEKMLEFRYPGNKKTSWIEWSLVERRFIPKIIDPALVQDYFPNFRMSIEPPSSSVIPKKQGALDTPLPRYANNDRTILRQAG